MDAIHIRKQIDSETLTLPELRPFIGSTVEILIQQAAPTSEKVISGSPEWEAVMAAAQSLHDYDYQAQADRDACDIGDAREQVK
jgi:hypothetical protein